MGFIIKLTKLVHVLYIYIVSMRKFSQLNNKPHEISLGTICKWAQIDSLVMIWRAFCHCAVADGQGRELLLTEKAQYS
jgi:hypothetical protein